LSLFGSEAGEPAWWVSVVEDIEDINDREQVEEKLRESEQRFRGLMEQAPLPISLFGPDGKIAEVNPAWIRSWGFDDSEVVRVVKEYNFLTDEQMAETGVLPLVRKAFAGDPVVLPLIEYSGVRSAGEMGLEDVEPATLWIQIHLYPIKDRQGKVERVVAINVDTTELKHAERDAREQRDALARVDRAARLSQLRGSISHELNQPLTGILSNAQAAELMLEGDRWTRDELAKIMSEIVSDAKRAGDVIRGLRELYREHNEDYSLIDINTVVVETNRLLHSEMVLQQVEFTTECAESLPRVSGNNVQIQQVLFNLIMNGVQAMESVPRDGRLVRVATALSGSEVVVGVEDRGPGIDGDKIDRIFEPLATWKPGGTGMGLAVSSSIIRAHGGRMWAENRPDGGARVGFAIPVPR
jgi:signal transduction histidine kinase